jgi:competence ComEA-like helix-hairpin-helix protein
MQPKKGNPMKTLSLENTPVQTPAVQLARLSGPHGYRLDGDTVHLNAMFALLDPAAHERAWALQLWACPSAPASVRDLAGHIVAEAPLPPMGEIADEIEHLDVSAAAWPPAGAGEHVMVLVLASGRPGQFHDIHDMAVYPRPQQFLQPRMSSDAGYRLDGARAQISVARIRNPRPEANRSGTLSLELWALPAPFAGGRFQGCHLAGVEIGSVNGQGELALRPIDLALTPPPPGYWQIVLMLREWTAAGFVTRDFANFATRYFSAPVVEEAPAPMPVVEKPSVPIAEKLPVLVVAKPAAPVVAKAAVSAQPAKAAADGSATRVSVNTARVEELAGVKGLSTKLAEGIVRKRPFASLDDLRRVKGLGANILAKVRSSLKL